MEVQARNVLLIYPVFPSTYWGLQYALPLLGKKAYMPPLGLITIAAMLPTEFQLRLIDLNCDALSDEDIVWADVVFISAMLPQKRSLFDVARRCRGLGKPVVMGGPFPTGSPDECAPWCDTVVVGEAEAVWETFLPDLIRDRLEPRYTSTEKPDITRTPVPRFDLLNVDNYLTIPIQFSRGCPFQCEFCDIIVMFGRRPRTKTPDQMVLELEAVKQTGYRGEIFIVDDNFIGNKKEVKRLLPALQEWNDANHQRFNFGTEASVDLAQHQDLMDQMARSGFRWVFLGIETPSMAGLKETLKFQNLRDPLTTSVDKVRASGMYVTAGFIIGFDSDGEDIFDRQIEFISAAGIAFSMVGLLFALDGTPLHARMQAAGRLHEPSPERDVDHCGYTNIKTILPRRTLLEGYRRVMATLYSPDQFFERGFQTLIRLKAPTSFRDGVAHFLAELRRNLRFLVKPGSPRSRPVRALSVVAAAYVLLRDLPKDVRRAFLRLVLKTLRTRPDKLAGTLELLVFGCHFHRFTLDHVLPQLDAELASMQEPVKQPEPLTIAV